MTEEVDIRSIELPIQGLEVLVDEAAADGHRFVVRLITDWESGENRFEKPGECLLGMFSSGRLIGLGGLNIDPYGGDHRCGRIRRFYIARDYRGKGYGRRLLEALIGHGRSRFDVLRLRTFDEGASRFYRACGFEAVAGEAATHAFIL